MTKQVERITYEDEWLDNVIQQAKYKFEELAKQTFNRYREIGKIILDSGYRKGTWEDKHKQKFMIELGIQHATFSNMVKLGDMEETEFSSVTRNFPSYYLWTHKGSLAKKAKREREIAVLREAIKFIEPPKQLYDVVVLDPPWNYGTEYNPDTRRVASPYPEMSVEEIKNLTLPTTENCVLWLWTTNAFMHDAFHILEAWGFQPKTILTWVKNRIGVGEWLRGQTEHCILAVKGQPTISLKSQSTVLHAPNKGHSEKPTEFYDFVDSLCVGWKLDYFARKKREGWHVLGTLEGEPTG